MRKLPRASSSLIALISMAKMQEFVILLRPEGLFLSDVMSFQKHWKTVNLNASSTTQGIMNHLLRGLKCLNGYI